MVIKDSGFSQKVTPHGTPPSPSEWTEITVPDHWLTLKVRIIERLHTDQVIMLSDLYGGSVNQIMYQWLTRSHTKLIAGVNLALVLELMAMKENINEFSNEQLLELTTRSREAIRFVTLDDEKDQDTTEEFF